MEYRALRVMRRSVGSFSELPRQFPTLPGSSKRKFRLILTRFACELGVTKFEMRFFARMESAIKEQNHSQARSGGGIKSVYAFR